MWGKTLRGMEVCEIPVRLPMNDTLMETVECITWVGVWDLVYAGLDSGIMSQGGRNAYPWHGLLN